MMKYAIKIVELVGMAPEHPPPDSGWVKSFDPEDFGGRGDLKLTIDAQEALVFGCIGDAIRCYSQQSITRPLRPDGRPNRPLTAFTVEIVELPNTA